MKPPRYRLSFTPGGLFHRESVNLTMLFLDFKDWSAVRDEVLANNRLQARTLNTSKRICREIISRLRTLFPSEMDLLVDGSTQEQRYILWIAVCRRYQFIADFAVEVIRERYLSLKTDLHSEDFDFFCNKKSPWHPELDELKPATRDKLRQNLFKMLREADFLTADNTINAALLSPRLLQAIPPDNRQDVLLFPAFESDFKGSHHDPG